MKNIDKDVGVYYKGGCGGFFTFFYILGLSLNLETSYKKLPLKGKILDFIFYKNFPLIPDLKLWKNSEHWPDLQFEIKNNYNKKLFLYCGPSVTEKNINCIKINPYVTDSTTWRRIQYEKRCNNYLMFPKKKYSYKMLFNYTKKIFLKKEVSIIDYCDYSFDFIKFISSIKEREKLCNFLNTNITEKSEEYLKHYIKCNGTLTKYLK